jgi:hypothetical protein
MLCSLACDELERERERARENERGRERERGLTDLLLLPSSV